MTEAILHALEPLSLLAALVGVLLGIVFGAIPGLTATLGIALLVPVTFLMSAEQGMIMLGGVYAGAIYGGSITAILLNIPGTPASAVSAWEGHAMARAGQAPLALGLSAASAGIGGVLSGVAMLLLTPLLASVALEFGPAEYVALILFSLVIVVVMLKTSLVGNAIGAFLGLLLATVGTDVMAGTPRFTAGFSQLTGGVGIVAVLIGLFCMSQAIVLGWESVTGRGLAPATDAKTCGQLIKDTQEMLNETEVTEDTDKAVEAMIKEASAQCKASEFGKATDTVVQARALLTKE